MTQPSLPPPFPPPHQPPSLPSGVQVRCAGCRIILTVAPGVTEFVCPGPNCKMPQMLPPELMARSHLKPPSPASPLPLPLPPAPAPAPAPAPPPLQHVPAHGIDPTKIQLPCAHCKAILNVPHGLARFACPQCGVDLAIDVSKVKHLFPPQPPPEEVNEVSIEVEREEDEGGMAGETFTDYRPPKVSI